MRTFVERSAVVPELVDVRCNLCGRDVKKNKLGYLEDHISIDKTWGYHSPFDGEAHAIDLCVDCYRGLASQFEILPHVEKVEYAWGS